MFSIKTALKHLHSIKTNVRRRRRYNRERRLIKESGLFDSSWYLKNYPDVHESGIDPLDHYMTYGASERRAAGPKFDTCAYVAANPDVEMHLINPLVHYIIHGFGDKRSLIQPINDPPESLQYKVNQNSITFSLIIRGELGTSTSRTLTSLYRQNVARIQIFAEHLPQNQLFLDKLINSGKADGAHIEFVLTHSRAPFLIEAVTLSGCDYVILLDSGDILVDNALETISHFIDVNTCDIVYSDESLWQYDEGKTTPVLKPGWSPELLCTYNYFGRLTAIRQKIALSVLSAVRVDAAVEWSLNLAVSQVTTRIAHVPQILCQRTAELTDRVRAVTHFEEYSDVIKSYWTSKGYEATISVKKDGTFDSKWTIKNYPLVSVILQNKDNHQLTECLDGILQRTDYNNIEVIVVDNGSTHHATYEIYNRLRKLGGQIVEYQEEFNYSRARNIGAEAAHGELLLFLDLDVEVVEKQWLKELVRQVVQPGVAVVGPKFLHPNGSIQHAAVLLRSSPLPAPIFHSESAEEWGPFGSPDVQRNCTAVVGACQLIHHDIFKLVGGYDETFQVSYSDIVLCISAVYAGFRTIYVPQAVIAHRDSALCEPSESTSDRALLAKRLREVGFDADPLFHPALDTLNFLQQIKPVDLCGSRGLRAAIECLAGTVDLRQPLDIYDDGAVASAIGYRWDKIIWSFTPTELFLEPVGAAGARIIIFFLRRRPDLRLRFPKALRDGAKGPFANWVRTEGIHLLRLPEEAGIWIDSAFNSNFDAAARHLLLHDSEFLRDTPFLFLPTGRAAVCKRLFTAFTEEAVTLEQIWWFLLVTAEAPLEELCLTWALTPSWQSAVPDGATAIGIFKLVKWVAATHNVTDDWLFEPFTPTNISEVEQLRIAYSSNQAWQDRFPNAFTNLDEARAFVEFLFTRASGLRFQGRNWLTQYDASTLAYELRKPGVNVLGHFAYPSGLRVSTESIVEGLRANDIALSLRNVPTSFTSDDPVWHRFVGIESFDTTIIHVQPRPFFENAYSLSGLRPRSSRTYRIGYWYWELDDVPPDWNRAAFDCDEFWVATEFIANSLSKNYPQPIKVLPPGVEIEPFEPLPRSYFGLKDGDYIFLFVFHMSSIMSRKNPLGLISAFAKAFESGDRARLVIKTSLGMAHPEQTEILRKAAADCGVILLEDTFSRSETLALLNICDAYVSLHRSEGLGLTMAEAMLLGKPTIGTRYSGNLDFMNDDNSLLCDCRIVTLNHDLLPYQRGQLWAEPSVGHAAQLMRSLYLNQGYGRDLGARSRRDLEARFSYKLNGARMAKRLAEIQSTF